MKQVGIFLTAFGIALLIFVIYSYFRSQSRLLSPLPEDHGVKVIFITPTQ